ncbi:acetyltransferase [Actinobacillus equuli subsp. haemolyticus]|uniref:acetyltransferase n=1 Tax=Actinobacillus equuli TaxID=718 RepID=UPI002441C412|nr:acetyltransferase [Actinobacillus equuli]WGE67655.1 acetyltransferase [Actinobacillus equuli subsp. haemolyticus]
MRKKIVLIGAGGYAKSVLDSLDEQQFEFCGFIDNFKPTGCSHLGCEIVNVIDKTAIVSNRSQLGKGVFVGKMAIVNAGVTVGDNVVINTKALVEHGCFIGNHCNISTNTTLNGDVIVEDFAFVGSSSVVNGQLRIGEKAMVASGAVVIRNVEPRTVVAGVPAKFIKEHNH